MAMKFNRCFGCMREIGENEVTCPHCGYSRESWKPDGEALEPGAILNGQYVLGKTIGQGGFGITYMGWDLNLEIKVAVKEYFPSFAVTRTEGFTVCTKQTGGARKQFESGKQRFMKEAKALARFSSVKEIVQVRNFFEENNTAYIIMEFLDGLTLKDYIQNRGGRMEPNDTVKLLLPVLEAVACIHKEEIVHRDISPDNIMILKDGSLKLLDFGNSKVLEENENGSKPTEVVLKEGFAPLEQYQSLGNPGPWMDVYSMSATMYYCITGQVPARSVDRVPKDILPIPSLSGVVIMPELEEILMKGMSVTVEERYPDMGAFHQVLKEYIDRIGPGPGPIPPEPGPGPDPSPGKILWRKILHWPMTVKLVAGLSVIAAALILIGTVVVLLPAASGARAVSASRAPEDSKPVKSGEETAELQKTEETAPAAVSLRPGEYRDGDFLFYVYETGGLELSAYTGSDAVVEIPADYKGAAVTAIGCGAFWGADEMEEVLIPNTVRSIGSIAFFDCKNLESVQLPKSLEYLGMMAFYGCQGLSEITIPENVCRVGEDVFSGCGSLTARCEIVREPDSWVEGWDNDLYDVKWGTVMVPEKWEEDHFLWSELEGGKLELIAYTGKKTRVKVPSEAEGGEVVSIGIGAFENRRDIEEVELPDSIREIKDSAFSWCENLSSINLPEKLEVIPEGCFRACNSMDRIVLPEGIKEVKQGAYYGCAKLERFVASDTVESIEYNALGSCPKLYCVAIPSGVKNLGRRIAAGSPKVEFYCEGKERQPGWEEDWSEGGLYVMWDVDVSQIDAYLELGVDSSKIVGSWNKDAKGWSYKNGQSYLVNGWHQILWRGDNLWYHFNKQGYVDTGWYKEGARKWYYLGGERGGMSTGLVDVDGNTYYLNPDDGLMAAGWVQLEGEWYYFDKKTGAMLKNTATPDGYLVGADGVMVK